jgi:hypothetical protein
MVFRLGDPMQPVIRMSELGASYCEPRPLSLHSDVPERSSPSTSREFLRDRLAYREEGGPIPYVTHSVISMQNVCYMSHLASLIVRASNNKGTRDRRSAAASRGVLLCAVRFLKLDVVWHREESVLRDFNRSQNRSAFLSKSSNAMRSKRGPSVNATGRCRSRENEIPVC